MRKYHNAYQRLLSLSNLVTKPYTDSTAELERSMKRMRDFLSALGDPDKKLNIIHVGGTSGKGSVVNMMHAVLANHTGSVGSYTSPHTTTYLERFKLTEKLVDPDKLAEYISHMLAEYQKFLQKNEPLSFFELSTCLALYTFAREKMKWCVLEVGCGGRFDATNVIDTPKAAIITNIDKDHTEILGASLSEIATKKAGIIKPDGVVICGETRPKLRRIFQNEAVKKSAALFFTPPPQEQILDATLGAHQQHNAALVLRACQELGIDLDNAKRSIVQAGKLPCRFETIQDSPRVILDGAHSPAKINAIAKLVKDLAQPVHVVFGCTASKDAKKMIELLAPVAASITTTRFHSAFRKASNPAALLAMVPKSKRASYFLESQKALSSALERAKSKETVLVTGSLFLAGELRTNWISEDRILSRRSSS